MRDLKSIQEEFVILNRYKDLLEKNKDSLKYKENSIEELNKINQDLKAIDELMKDLQIEVNEWASNYNKEKDNIIIEEQPKEQSNKEKFYENRELLKQTKKESKSLQPKISSQDKNRKDEILKNAGFVETQTVDHRKIFIHPSLVGKYYDLVKEQRKLSEILAKEYREEIKRENNVEESKDFNESLQEQSEEKITSEVEETKNIIQESTKTLDEEIEDIKKQINYILNESHGRKMFVKYKGEKYYIPRAERGKFLTLLSELNRLQNINNKNVFDTSNVFETIDNPEVLKDNYNEETPYETTENIRFIEETNIPSPRFIKTYETDEEYENYLKQYSERYYGNDKTKNGNIQDYLDSLDNSAEKDDKKRQQELFDEIEKNLKKQQYNPNTELVPYEPAEELEFIEGTSIPKPRPRKTYETDEEYEKYLEDHYNKYKNQFKIKKARKPKFKNKIKKFLKKAIAIALVAVTLIAGKIKLADHKDKTPKEPTLKTEQSIDDNIDEELDDEIDDLTDDLENQDLQENIEENALEDLNIGSTITLNQDSKIYKTAKDSILEENQYRPYYDNNNEQRVVLGVSIQHNGELIKIFAHMDNAKERILELLNDGGTIESVLTGNIEHETSLKNFQGDSKLSVDEINDKAEGWYNINSVANRVERGYSK